MDRDADGTSSDTTGLESKDDADVSPLNSVSERVQTPDLLSEGPVRFLLVAGDQDDGNWGLVGSFWLSIDGERGGFFVSPRSLWRGSEMVRSYKGARSRGWTDADIYAYWQGQVGISGAFMIDPQQHADNLFQVARRVGAL
jgi:hypothetical protein